MRINDSTSLFVCLYMLMQVSIYMSVYTNVNFYEFFCLCMYLYKNMFLPVSVMKTVFHKTSVKIQMCVFTRAVSPEHFLFVQILYNSLFFQIVLMNACQLFYVGWGS